ncbi:unnamed protein product, partial [marine sediment metagenome]
AMSGKFRGKKEFSRIVKKFFDNCKSRGYPDKITREVWRQIESFAGYSFSKAHSASYAVESFQSLYLKAHFPIEFMVAVINNFGGFYRTWVYVHEAKRFGANIRLPCVNQSNYTTTICKKDIYLGFVHVQNLETAIGQTISKERERNGPFSSLEDFTSRVSIGIEQLIILIRIDAFRFTEKPKKQLLWEAHVLLGKSKGAESGPALFQSGVKRYKLPSLIQSRLEDAYDEIELLGFPVTLSWFDFLQTSFRGDIRAGDLKNSVGKKVKMAG